MTVKVLEIVTDALEDLVELEDESSLPQAESMAAVRYLNDMMAAWESLGIDLGYTTVSGLGDIVTVPDGAILGIKANLTLILAPKYDVLITEAMRGRASFGYQICIKIAISIEETEYPDTLPVGSGNQPSYGSSYFPGEEEEEDDETEEEEEEAEDDETYSSQYVNEDSTFTLISGYHNYLILCSSDVGQTISIDDFTAVETGFTASIMKVSTGDTTISLPSGILGITWGDGTTGDITLTTISEAFVLTFNFELNKIFFSYTGAYTQA